MKFIGYAFLGLLAGIAMGLAHDLPLEPNAQWLPYIGIGAAAGLLSGVVLSALMDFLKVVLILAAAATITVIIVNLLAQ